MITKTGMLALGTLALAIVLLLLMVFVVGMAINWANGLDDPVERGLAYVTLAILAHATFRGSSSSSSCSKKS